MLSYLLGTSCVSVRLAIDIDDVCSQKQHSTVQKTLMKNAFSTHTRTSYTHAYKKKEDEVEQQQKKELRQKPEKRSPEFREPHDIRKEGGACFSTKLEFI